MKTFASVIFSIFIFCYSALAGPVNDAAKSGDIAALKAALDGGADANEEDAMASPLHWAAMRGYVDAITLLADKGAALDAKSDMLGTALHAAADFGQVDAINALTGAGADIEARNRDDLTPLISAVLKRKGSSVDALLAAGADPNAVGIGKNAASGMGPLTALQLALDQGQPEIAEKLLAAGAKAMPPEVPDTLDSMGDATRGKELAYTFCSQCHVIAAGDDPKLGHVRTGPPLIGVMGRPVADIPGFEYSDALLAHGGDWTAERFYAFALTPMLTVPGTLMNWAPDRNPQMIADITAYFAANSY